MAGNIKGITIEIGGNTTKLDKALKGVDSKARSMQSELKQINALLKFDPKNTEVLTQKQKVLSESIASTKEKLSLLKEAQRQVAEQFARGEVSEEQYRRINREVAFTEQSISKLENELSSLNSTSKELDLDAQMKKAEESAQGLQKELDEVNKLLKLDPKNTEILAQKQKILSESVAGTKEKLSLLREEQQRVAEQFARGEIGEEQYRKINREIVETEQNLKSLKKELDDTNNKWKSAGESIEKLGKGAEKAGKAVMPLSAAATGLGVGMVKTAADFEAGMSEVKAISRASEENMARLSEKAQEMGATTKFSATESAEALKYMAMAGWDTEKMLDGLPAVMHLAAASGAELGLSSDIVTDAMTAMKMSASEASRFVDVLARTSTSTNTNVELMGESFKYAAPLAGALGYSIEDMGLALGIMANNGTKASEAGTSLRSIFSRIAKPTKEVEGALCQLGLAAEDLQGKSLDETLRILRKAFSELNGTQQVAVAAGLAGKNAMSGMLALIQASDAEYDSLKQQMDSAKGAAEEMMDVMNDNLKGSLVSLSSAVEAVAISLGSILSPVVRQVADGLKGFANWLNSLSPAAQKTIVVILAIVAALGPLLILIGKVALGVSGVMKFIGMLGPALAGLSGTATATGGVLAAAFSPVGIAIAAVVAAVVLLIKHWDDVKYYAQLLWYTLEATWNDIKESVLGAIGGIREGISNAWDGIKESVSSKVAAIGDGLKSAVTSWKDGISSGWNEIKSKTGSVWSDIQKNLSTRLGEIGNKFKESGGGYKGVMAATWEAMKQSSALQWNGIKLTIGSIAKVLGFDLSGSWVAIESKAKTAWENVKSSILRPIEAAKDKIKKIIDAIKGFFSGMKLEIPKIKMPKLPKFEMKGSFSLNPPQVPSIGVNWYKQGGIFSAPSIIGVGEAGKEAVLPIDRLDDIMARAMEKIGGAGMSFTFQFNEPVTVRSEDDIERIADRAAQKIKQAIQAKRKAAGYA